jgi:hypothetical protein
MATTFKRGQELGRANGLNIFLTSKDKTPKNAAEITYSLYDYTLGIEVLIPPSNRIPINPSIGEYYASFIIPMDASIGRMRIRWLFRQFIGSQLVEVLQEFAVVQDATQVVTLAGISHHELDLIRGLRILLRDANPSRNYHFQAPSSEESVNQFTRVFGYLWEDDELLEFLKMSNDSINMYPPQTFYETLDQLMIQHKDWRTLCLVGASIYALQALSINWSGEEFGYSIGGVSLDIEKSSKYQSLMNDAQNRFQEFVDQAKQTVKIIRGLKQSRYGVGIRSSFGPNVGRGTLTPRRFLGI